MKRIVLCSTICLFLAASGASYAQSSTDRLQVKFPGKRWGVVVNSPGFTVQTNSKQQDGRQYLVAVNDESGMYLSVILERTRKKADPGICPAYVRERVESFAGLGLQDVKYSSTSTMAIAEYIVPDLAGYKLQQKHLLACAAREDIYIDIHLSKGQFKAEEEQLFTSLIEAVKIEEISGK